MPGVVEHKLRVLHCLKRPTTAPIIISDTSRTVTKDQRVLIAEREKSKETAELKGYVRLDAASVGQVRLEASWSDIDDNPQHPEVTLTRQTPGQQRLRAA